MLLALFLGLYILSIEVLSKWHGPVIFHGHIYPLAIIMIPLVFPIRDMIQQRKHRGYAILAMTIASITFYFTTRLNEATYAAVALLWAELFDFVLYSYFRRYGWVAGMIISDLAAVPFVLGLYVYLSVRNIHIIPTYLYEAQYVVLFAFYVVIFLTPLRKLFVGIPALRGKTDRTAG